MQLRLEVNQPFIYEISGIPKTLSGAFRSVLQHQAAGEGGVSMVISSGTSPHPYCLIPPYDDDFPLRKTGKCRNRKPNSQKLESLPLTTQNRFFQSHCRKNSFFNENKAPLSLNPNIFLDFSLFWITFSVVFSTDKCVVMTKVWLDDSVFSMLFFAFE